MAKEPVSITIYDQETSEPIRTLRRGFIPWRILGTAVRLSKNLNPTNMTEEDVASITDLVVDTFGGKVTAEELRDGADVEEMMNVIFAIIARANGTVTNPTPPVA
jgi:hypothetical protein